MRYLYRRLYIYNKPYIKQSESLNLLSYAGKLTRCLMRAISLNLFCKNHILLSSLLKPSRFLNGENASIHSEKVILINYQHPIPLLSASTGSYKCSSFPSPPPQQHIPINAWRLVYCAMISTIKLTSSKVKRQCDQGSRSRTRQQNSNQLIRGRYFR
jgi:hypothetical protein